MRINQKYLEVVGGVELGKDGVKMLQVEVYYSKGGMNYFSGEESKRGYFLAVRPVEVKQGSVSFMMFDSSAKKMLLLEVARQSPKAQAQAVALAAVKEAELVAVVASAAGLTVLAAEQGVAGEVR